MRKKTGNLIMASVLLSQNLGTPIVTVTAESLDKEKGVLTEAEQLDESELLKKSKEELDQEYQQDEVEKLKSQLEDVHEEESSQPVEEAEEKGTPPLVKEAEEKQAIASRLLELNQMVEENVFVSQTWLIEEVNRQLFSFEIGEDIQLKGFVSEDALLELKPFDETHVGYFNLHGDKSGTKIFLFDHHVYKIINNRTKETVHDGVADPNFSFENVPGTTYTVILNHADLNSRAVTHISTPLVYGEVMVQNVDENNNEIVPSQTIEGIVGQPFEIDQGDFEGFVLKEVQGKESGKFSTDKQTVRYLYAEIFGEIIVRHMDDNGNELVPTETLKGRVGTTFETESLKLEGYELVNVKGIAGGRFTKEDQAVTYVYAEVFREVIVSHLDEARNELSPMEILTGRVGTRFETQPIVFERKILSKVQGETAGTFGNAPQFVTYVYADVVQANDFDDEQWLIDLVNEILYPLRIGENVTAKDLATIKEIRPEGLQGGTIPPGIERFTGLEILDLSNLDLHGEIPSELGNLYSLKELYLNNNHLSGEIPRDLSQLINLHTLTLSGNHLLGQIPSEILSLNIPIFDVSNS